MRFERKFLAFKEGDAPSATDYDINNLIDMLNDHFGESQADWLEEETRFAVGTLTVVVFKLSYFDDEEDTVVVLGDDVPLKHFAVALDDDDEEDKDTWAGGGYKSYDDSWW